MLFRKTPIAKVFDTMENGATSDGSDPSSFLQEIIGAPVTVKLNSGVVYKGKSNRHLYHGIAC